MQPKGQTSHPNRTAAMNTSTQLQAARYELRFQSLFDEGRGYAFPCDEEGHVNIDTLSTKARLNYFYARTVIGREFSLPALRVLH
jgi:hypothetical protein